MKILVANPNSSEAVTEGIIGSAKKKIVNPKTEVIPLTNYRGTRNIDCAFADYQSTWSSIRGILKKVEEIKADAVVLAGFGNVGIFALKEALSIPMLSMSETSMAIACLMGHKFTVLTTMRQMIPSIEDLIRVYGMQHKCASIRGIDVNVEKSATDPEATLTLLKEESRKILEQDDGTEVIILGSGGLCKYDEELQKFIKLPVIDPVAVTVKVAEMMVESGLCHSKRRKFAYPPQELSAYLTD